jgi:hypothetical protein
MKALGFRRALPIDEPESVIDFDAVKPTPESRDLLVAVRAVSVNPVDTKCEPVGIRERHLVRDDRPLQHPSDHDA